MFQKVLKAINSSILYGNAGGKYGLADKRPVSYKEQSFLLQIMRLHGFLPIPINHVSGL
jgi:hypothetical protein